MTPRIRKDLYCLSAKATIMYGAKLWAQNIQHKETWTQLDRSNYRAVRATMGYVKTTSTINTLILSGSIPLSSMAKIETQLANAEDRKAERKRLFDIEYDALINKAHYENVIQLAQHQDLKKQPASSQITQVLSTHGPWGTNLNRFGMKRNPTCRCGHATQDVEHLSVCPIFPSTLPPIDPEMPFQDLQELCLEIVRRGRSLNP